MIAAWTTRARHYDMTTTLEVDTVTAAVIAWFESGDLFPLRVDGEWIVSRDSTDQQPAGVVEVHGLAQACGFPVTFWVAPQHERALREAFARADEPNEAGWLPADGSECGCTRHYRHAGGVDICEGTSQ